MVIGIMYLKVPIVIHIYTFLDLVIKLLLINYTNQQKHKVFFMA